MKQRQRDPDPYVQVVAKEMEMSEELEEFVVGNIPVVVGLLEVVPKCTQFLPLWLATEIRQLDLCEELL